MIQQRAVAVGRVLQALQEPAEELDLPGVQLDEQRQLLRAVAVMRHVVPRLVEPEVREHELAGLAVQHEAEDARDVGLVGHRHQVEHHGGVLFPRVRDAHGRHRQRQFGRCLLFGALDAGFDLTDVLEVLIEADAIAAAEAALERGDVSGHRVEDAAVLLHPPDALFHRAGPAEHALEDGARVGLERNRLRRRLPRDRVHVGAAVAGVTGADVAGEVLGGDLDRGEDRLLSDLVGDDLIERGPVPEILGLGALRGAARQPGAGADRVGTLRRPIEVRDHVDVVAELFDRLEDRAELEADARWSPASSGSDARPSARTPRRSGVWARRRCVRSV